MATSTDNGTEVLVGRERESTVVQNLIRQAALGRGGALVLRGDAGIGKTALIAGVLHETDGESHLSITGAEFEKVIPFAGIQQLCAAMPGRRENLPPRQQSALQVAFGEREGKPPNPFLVGLAVLGLLSDEANGIPVVCVVEDAQWLDDASAQVLAFVARRIDAEHIAMLISVREPSDTDQFRDLPELRIEGLRDEYAHLLLDRRIHAPIDPLVRHRIVGEARGNPLALLELPIDASAGGYAAPDVRGTANRIEATFLQRISALPAQTMTLLLIAAAEPLGDPVLLWKAMDHLDISPDAVIPAEEAGLLDIGPTVQFRHPLVRSAAYRAATREARRRAHAALAAVTDAATDLDRQAWHRAQAAVRPDEHLADDLEGSAGRAQARGGLAAAAAFMERAAELTPARQARGARTLEAARLAQVAGKFPTALRLITAVEDGALPGPRPGETMLLRAQIAFSTSRDDKAVAALIDAAEALDVEHARRAYLEAFVAAMYVGRSSPERMRQVAHAVRALPAHHVPSSGADLLVDGLAEYVVLGYAAAVPALRRALNALTGSDPVTTSDLQWLGLACTVAMDLLDDSAHAALADRLLRSAHESGALASLPGALNYRSGVHLLAGELNSAAALVGEGYTIASAIGGASLPYGELALAAWRGDKRRVEALVRDRGQVAERGEGRTLNAIDYARAVLHNGLGTYDQALAATTEVVEPEVVGFSAFLSSELVEAASRVGSPEAAGVALERLALRAEVSGTDWAIGLHHRAQAQLLTDAGAEERYLSALHHLGRTRIRSYHGRTQLIYGEWLRRRGRRNDARVQLGAAYEALSSMGLHAFADRAARELGATGEHARPRKSTPLETLTTKELDIARRAAAGATSKEIAAALFLSPRTIDAHLRNIFRKTAVTSRRQLRDLPLDDIPG